MREFQRIQLPVETVLVAQDDMVLMVRVDGMVRWQELPDQVPTATDRDRMKNCWRLQQEIPLKLGARYIITHNLNKKAGVYNGQGCIYEGDGHFRLMTNGHIVLLEELRSQCCVKSGP